MPYLLLSIVNQLRTCKPHSIADIIKVLKYLEVVPASQYIVTFYPDCASLLCILVLKMASLSSALIGAYHGV